MSPNGVEYNRIAGEMDDLRNRKVGITQDEILRQDMLGRIQKIAELLRSMDGGLDSDDELFGMLVERIRVLNQSRLRLYCRPDLRLLKLSIAKIIASKMEADQINQKGNG